MAKRYGWNKTDYESKIANLQSRLTIANKKLITWQAVTDANADFVERIKELEGALEKTLPYLTAYQRAVMDYAKESAHKGNRSNQSFWEKEAKAVRGCTEKATEALKG